LDTKSHIENIGKMVEDMENLLRNEIEEIYFKKTKEVSNITILQNYRFLIIVA
jgi:hypothetical protein